MIFKRFKWKLKALSAITGNVFATQFDYEKFQESKSIGQDERQRSRKRDKYKELRNDPADGRQRGRRRTDEKERERETRLKMFQFKWVELLKYLECWTGPAVPAFPFRHLPPPAATAANFFRAASRAGRSPSVTRTKFRISWLFILPHYRPSAFLLLSFLKQLMACYVPQFIFHRLHAERFWATSP